MAYLSYLLDKSELLAICVFIETKSIEGVGKALQCKRPYGWKKEAIFASVLVLMKSWGGAKN